MWYHDIVMECPRELWAIRNYHASILVRECGIVYSQVPNYIKKMHWVTHLKHTDYWTLMVYYCWCNGCPPFFIRQMIRDIDRRLSPKDIVDLDNLVLRCENGTMLVQAGLMGKWNQRLDPDQRRWAAENPNEVGWYCPMNFFNNWQQ